MEEKLGLTDSARHTFARQASGSGQHSCRPTRFRLLLEPADQARSP